MHHPVRRNVSFIVQFGKRQGLFLNATSYYRCTPRCRVIGFCGLSFRSCFLVFLELIVELPHRDLQLLCGACAIAVDTFHYLLEQCPFPGCMRPGKAALAERLQGPFAAGCGPGGPRRAERNVVRRKRSFHPAAYLSTPGRACFPVPGHCRASCRSRKEQGPRR